VRKGSGRTVRHRAPVVKTLFASVRLSTIVEMSNDRDDTRALRLIHPLRDFLTTEAAGGVVLVLAIGVALVWANVRPTSYEDFWTSTFTIGFAEHHLTLSLRDWVNDGLMAVFFFVVGLEIKRELVEGELREPRKAALPAIAAIGGMTVPVLIYLAFTAGDAGSEGWGIPMATDIAIAVGVLSLLGSRVAPQLKLFLLALAIVDDIGAIVVIALFYSSSFEWEPALGAIAVIGVMFVLRWFDVRSLLPYVVLGLGVWLLVHESALHATIAGVVLGLLAPTRPFRHPDMVDAEKLADVSTVQTAQETVVFARESVSVVEWLEYQLHPWSSYLIVPVFALANAGVVISSDSIADAASSPVTHGIVVGLVVGKLVGITSFTWIACRLGVGALPDDTRWSEIAGIAALGGIGFTVSLFVSNLAFRGSPVLESNAKLGILTASVVAALLGTTILLMTRNRTRRSGPGT
jgi:NhaA family Na+:H+ antiporter